MIYDRLASVNCRSLLVERRFLDSHVKSRSLANISIISNRGMEGTSCFVQLLTFNFQASRAIFLDPRSILETTFFRTFPREMKIQRSPTKRLARVVGGQAGVERRIPRRKGDEQEDENRTQSVSGQRRKREE